jgi:cytoskeletal protein CcmA (bactofilin family)
MATIKIRRGSGQPAIGGSGLTAYEPAWDTVNNRFFINNGSTAMWIGAAVVQDTTLSGNCAWTIPTQQSVKTYVDNSVSAGAVSSVNGVTGAMTIGGGTAISIATSTSARGITVTNTGVWSINGSTGSISNVAFTNVAQTFTALQAFSSGLSATTGTFTGLLSPTAGINASGGMTLAGSFQGSTATFNGAVRANSSVTILGGATTALLVNGGVTFSGVFAKDIAISGIIFGNANNSGSENVIIGGDLRPNTTGTRSISSGSKSLFSNTTGSRNISLGRSSMENNLDGSDNVAIGDSALLSNTSSLQNVAIGSQALESSTTFGDNTAVGFKALRSNSAGNNTAVGSHSLISSNTGSYNVSLGYFAGASGGTAGAVAVTKPINSVFIGALTRSGSTSGEPTNEIVIGADAVGFGDNTAVIGTTAQSAAYIYGQLNAFGGLSASGATFSGNINAPNLVTSVDGVTGAVDLLAGTGLSITLPTGANKGITLANTGVVGITGTVNQVTVSATTGSVTLSLPSTIVAPGSLAVTGLLNPTAGISANGGMTLAGSLQAAAATFGGLVTANSGLVVTGGVTFNSNITAPNIVTSVNGLTGAITDVASLNGATGAVTVGAGTGISIATSTAARGITVTNVGVTGLTGTANQITVSGTTGSITLTLPSAITAPGSLATTTTLSVGTDLTVSGNLTVNGTTTTVNSTTVTVQDPLIAIGGVTSNAPPPVGDTKDRGILFQWGDGTAGRTGFFGLDQSTGRFTFLPLGVSVSGEVVTGTAGNAEFAGIFAPQGSLNLTGSCASSASVTIVGSSAAQNTSVGIKARTTTFGVDSNLPILALNDGNSIFGRLQLVSTLTADRSYSLPDISGQMVLADTAGATSGWLLRGQGSSTQNTWINPQSSGFTAYSALGLQIGATLASQNFNLVFANGNSGYQLLYADTNNDLQWNPGTRTLTLDNGNGKLEGVVDGGSF